MVSEASRLTENFEALRTGFIWSLLSLCLLLFIGLGRLLFYAGSALEAYFAFELFSPFLILFVWAYGVHKRVEGWTQLGQKNVADKLSLSWKINLFFILPLPFIVLFLGGLDFLVSPYAPLPWAVVTCVVWGYSTVCETRGLKKLVEEKKIRLGLSRTCSLAAILVYACGIFAGYVALATQPSLIGFLVFAFLPLYFSILGNAIVFASPLLIISCVNAIVQLKHASVPQTARETPDLSLIEPLTAYSSSGFFLVNCFSSVAYNSSDKPKYGSNYSN